MYRARQGINMTEKVLQLSGKTESYLNDIAAKMGASLKVGCTPVATVAFLNEFGHGGVNAAPPRPFFRNMINSESPNWGVKISKLAKLSQYNGKAIFKIMGEDIKGALMQSITDLTSPPLAESTKKAKGFDKPLIDTAHMINSITYEVK